MDEMTSEIAAEPASASKRRGLGLDLLCVAALAVVLAILLHESLFEGKGLVPADAILQYSPWNQAIKPANNLLADQFLTFLPTAEFVHRQRTVPLWNPCICCGAPNLGAIQGALFFPIRLLLSPMEPFSSAGVAAFLKLFLAGCFTMIFVRLLGASRPAALLSAIVFSLSGFMIVWLGHPHVNCAMWLPLLLFFVEKSFQKEAGRGALGIYAAVAVVFACMILGGHPPTAIHVALVVGIYFVVRLTANPRDRAVRRCALFAGSIAVGLLLAAPQILPFVEYYRNSSSPDAVGALNRWSARLGYPALIHFLLPNVMGSPVLGFEDLTKVLGWPEVTNYMERTGYVGVVPLFLAACSLIRRRCKFVRFFWSLALASVLIACGLAPISALLRFVPILCNVDQTRLLLIAGFSVAILSAFGWDEIVNAVKTKKIRIVAIAFCALVGTALLCFFLVVGPKLHGLDAASQSFVDWQILIPLGGLVVVALLACWPVRWNRSIPFVVCLGWTAFDLLHFAIGFNPSIPRDLYYPSTPGIQWLQKDKSLFRILGGGSMLPPNAAQIYGLSDARGCDFMSVKRYQMLITGNSDEFFFYRNPDNIPAALPLLNIKYFFGEKPLPLNPRIFDLVYSNEFLIYRNNQCLDRAFIVDRYEVEPDRGAILDRVSSGNFDPRQLLLLEQPPPPLPGTGAQAAAATTLATSVRIVSYEPDAIKIYAQIARPGFLILLDTYFPGWTASVNGQPAPILRADYNFRAVPLPAGSSTVEFSYFPESLRAGLWLCGVGVLALVLAFIVGSR